MYLRDLIKIGGISGPIFGTEERLNYNNSVIKSIEKDSKNNLVVSLIKQIGDFEGKVRIKSQTGSEDNVLERILSSSKVIGKTLGELGDTELKDL